MEGHGRSLLVAGIALSTVLAPLSSLAGQDPIRQRRAELDRIRTERAELERQARALEATVHDLSAAITNLDRRAAATARLVRTLDRQLATIATEVAQTTLNVRRAETELAAKRGVLRQRLIDIYKRGPLFPAQALLSATSFGELVARYKYLHLVALRDRALVHRVENLRAQIISERDRQLALQRNLADSREDRRIEEGRLGALQDQQRDQLARAQRDARLTNNRLARARTAEAQLTNVIADLEAERRRAEARRPVAAPAGASSIRVADRGRLAWPVTGPLVYTFGREVQANNTSIRWNGIGIRAPSGTPVKAVSSGTVVAVQPLGTYQLTVIVDHGGGDYSIYGSLTKADVQVGARVTAGQAIGEVGVSDPELPPHLHFEIRHNRDAVDPLRWLVRR